MTSRVCCYLQLSPSDADVVEQHKSALNEAKAYVRRTTVVMLGEKERGKDDKQQEKEEEEKRKQVRAATVWSL